MPLDRHCTVTQCLDCRSLCNIENQISMLSFFTQPLGQILQCVLCVSRRGLLIVPFEDCVLYLLPPRTFPLSSFLTWLCWLLEGADKSPPRSVRAVCAGVLFHIYLSIHFPLHCSPLSRPTFNNRKLRSPSCVFSQKVLGFPQDSQSVRQSFWPEAICHWSPHPLPHPLAWIRRQEARRRSRRQLPKKTVAHSRRENKMYEREWYSQSVVEMSPAVCVVSSFPTAHVEQVNATQIMKKVKGDVPCPAQLWERC